MVRNPLVDVFASSPVRPIQEHMEKVHEVVALLPKFMMATQKGDWKEAEKLQRDIVVSERAADKMKNSVRTHLPKRLFMPVSRGDLLQLVTVQDRIANCAKDVAGLMTGRRMQIPKPIWKEFKEYTKACVAVSAQTLTAINTLDEVFEVGFSRREVKQVESLIKEIGKLEKRTDKLQISLRASLFKIEGDLPPVDVMFLYQVIEKTGDLADYAERAGNRLQVLIST